jgi:hypothetical protein
MLYCAFACRIWKKNSEKLSVSYVPAEIITEGISSKIWGRCYYGCCTPPPSAAQLRTGIFCLYVYYKMMRLSRFTINAICQTLIVTIAPWRVNIKPVFTHYMVEVENKATDSLLPLYLVLTDVYLWHEPQQKQVVLHPCCKSDLSANITSLSATEGILRDRNWVKCTRPFPLHTSPCWWRINSTSHRQTV